MKAVQISRYGHVGVLSVTQDALRPAASGGKVVVEVRFASLNPADSMLRMGYMAKMAPLTFHATLGTDLAGVVVETGAGVSGLSKGDMAYGTASLLGGGTGAFAQFAGAPAGTLAKVPDGLGLMEAAAVPLTAVSALEIIDEKLKVRKGQKLLIHGGSGGIGTIAIQLAKHRGAFVTTTVLGASAAAYAKALGADAVIDAQKESFETTLSGYDFVLDTVAGETYRKSFAVLKEGGSIVSMLERPNTELMAQFGVTALFQGTQVTSARLDAVSDLIRRQIIKVHVDRVFPVDQVKEAFQARESGNVRGKIVLSFT